MGVARGEARSVDENWLAAKVIRIDSSPAVALMAREMESGTRGWSLIVGIGLGFALLVGGSARGATIVFKDGRIEKDIKIVTRDQDKVVVQLPAGVIHFPLSAIQAIDGKAIGGTPGRAESSGIPLREPEAEAEAAPSDVPDLISTEALPAEEAEGDPWIVEPDLPTTSGATANVADPGPDASVSRQRWIFPLVLLGIIVVGGIWMRSVQAVQKDLWNRNRDPRLWSLIALLLPGLGALLYLIWRIGVGMVSSVRTRFQANRGRRKPKKSEESPDPEGEPPASRLAPPKGPPVDPGPTSMPVAAPSWKDRKLPPIQPLGAPASDGFEFLGVEGGDTGSSGSLVSGLEVASVILQDALRERASDVHIEPSEGGYRVRQRLDGILHEKQVLETRDGKRLVTSIKTLAQIDIAEKRKAQDGKFRVRVGGREVDFRVATANSIYGEKVVIRVLDNASDVFDLTSLGMNDDLLEKFNSVVRSRSGMILATGPTGSGKTSTLYAALRALDGSKLNIMTIEDPVEYELGGATQIAVNPKAGVTYESGLRSILRQDPDVILVGEMRDTEAAEVALRAALTGHLVLSSLHTKDAVGTLSRLQDMRIERYQVASALLMVIAQRLVRTLCPTCRQPYECRGDELESIGFSFDPGSTLYAAAGCDDCRGTGFRGRTGMFELLVMDEEIRSAVSEGMSEQELLTMAREKGFRGYQHDGAEKVLMGITTIEEVLETS